MKRLILLLVLVAPCFVSFAEDNGNRGLSEWDRKRLLMDLRRAKIISSVRRAELMTDAQILELHTKVTNEQRITSLEKKVGK